MDNYFASFSSKLDERKGLIPWSGWIRHKFEDYKIDLDAIPDKEFNQIVLSISALISELVECTKQQTKKKVTAQILSDWLSDYHERMKDENRIGSTT